MSGEWVFTVKNQIQLKKRGAYENEENQRQFLAASASISWLRQRRFRHSQFSSYSFRYIFLWSGEIVSVRQFSSIYKVNDLGFPLKNQIHVKKRRAYKNERNLRNFFDRVCVIFLTATASIQHASISRQRQIFILIFHLRARVSFTKFYFTQLHRKIP